ncbi:MAG: dihydroorotate dehydrogenase electron transfer subunit [Planctomycetes bacterium]|nr:dihydroorotate dehydrogenase electron transfer subunit [Planctomycetota bacterium]
MGPSAINTAVSLKPQPNRGIFIARVAAKRDLGSDYKSLIIDVESDAATWLSSAQPGQFLQIACHGPQASETGVPYLRRPFSIASVVTENGACLVEVIHNVIGPGTRWLSQCQIGDPVNVIGPLGCAFGYPQSLDDPVLLVGGGIGIPPILFMAKRLADLGYRNRLGFAGMQSVEQFQNSIHFESHDPSNPLKAGMVLEQFTQSETASIIATDDGSFGFGGNVVAALDETIKQDAGWANARIYACGPMGMLKAIAELALEREMEYQVCVEAYMSCGFGVCQSCVVPVWVDPDSGDLGEDNRAYELVCTAGPVFDSRKIRWD